MDIIQELNFDQLDPIQWIYILIYSHLICALHTFMSPNKPVILCQSIIENSEINQPLIKSREIQYATLSS